MKSLRKHIPLSADISRINNCSLLLAALGGLAPREAVNRLDQLLPKDSGDKYTSALRLAYGFDGSHLHYLGERRKLLKRIYSFDSDKTAENWENKGMQQLIATLSSSAVVHAYCLVISAYIEGFNLKEVKVIKYFLDDAREQILLLRRNGSDMSSDCFIYRLEDDMEVDDVRVTMAFDNGDSVGSVVFATADDLADLCLFADLRQVFELQPPDEKFDGYYVAFVWRKEFTRRYVGLFWF